MTGTEKNDIDAGPKVYDIPDWRVAHGIFEDEIGSVDPKKAQAKCTVHSRDGQLFIETELPDGRRADLMLEMDQGCLKLLGYFPRPDEDGPNGKVAGLTHDSPLLYALIGPSGTVVEIGNCDKPHTQAAFINAGEDPNFALLTPMAANRAIEDQKAEGLKMINAQTTPDATIEPGAYLPLFSDDDPAPF